MLQIVTTATAACPDSGGYPEGESSPDYCFEESDLEPTRRRDTDSQLKAARARLLNLVMDADDGEDDEPVFNEAALENWLDAFGQSTHFQQLTPEQQNNVP